VLVLPELPQSQNHSSTVASRGRCNVKGCMTKSDDYRVLVTRGIETVRFAPARGTVAFG
jgi:hypothetical protein